MNARELRDLSIAGDPVEARVRQEAAMATFDQTEGALERLQIDPATLMAWPWSSVDAVTGKIWPDDIVTVCAHSGNGKTTFLSQCINPWLAAGKTIYVVTLEQDPKEYRTALAALALGFHPQRALENDWPYLPLGAAQRLADEIRRQRTALAGQLHFSPSAMVKPAEFDAEITRAVYLKADILILDHVGHLDYSDKAYSELARFLKKLKHDANQLGLPVLMAAQMNRGDRNPLAPYYPPNLHDIEMGGKILQVSSIVLGAYRPLVETCSTEDEREIRRGKLKIKDFVEKETIALAVLKGRKRGEDRGETVKLAFRRGRIVDPADEARAALEERYAL
jgi:replicative DNA helicase